jgi:hypothetical protein
MPYLAFGASKLMNLGRLLCFRPEALTKLSLSPLLLRPFATSY